MMPLFSETDFYEMIARLFRGDGLVFLMIMVCTLIGGIVLIAGGYLRHRERIAMIERGIDPDTKKEFVEEPENPPERKIG